MNLPNKLKEALNETRQLEGQNKDLITAGKRHPLLFHNISYYLGVGNALSFIIHVLSSTITEDEFDSLIKQLLHPDEEKTN